MVMMLFISFPAYEMQHFLSWLPEKNQFEKGVQLHRHETKTVVSIYFI